MFACVYITGAEVPCTGAPVPLFIISCISHQLRESTMCVCVCVNTVTQGVVTLSSVSDSLRAALHTHVLPVHHGFEFRLQILRI
jgi:hypothetical protein